MVGVDDLWIAAQVTTVRMPCAEAGAAAARLLTARIKGDAPSSTVVLPTELVARASTGPAPTRRAT